MHAKLFGKLHPLSNEWGEYKGANTCTMCSTVFYIYFGSRKTTNLQKMGIFMAMKAQDYYVREEGVLVKVTQLMCLPVWF